MSAPLPDLTKLKPAGGKRSSKREQIVNVFLRQEGHLSADDLVDLIRSEDHRISRATVYRTLQWMVDAGIARKVDFGEGRFRFEHSCSEVTIAHRESERKNIKTGFRTHPTVTRVPAPASPPFEGNIHLVALKQKRRPRCAFPALASS